jgi:hypothetical protein
VTLKDQNQNYRFESESEKIGFLDTTIVIDASKMMLLMDSTVIDSLEEEPEEVRRDTSKVVKDSMKVKVVGPEFRLRIFDEDKTLFLKEKNTSQYGLVKLVFSRPPFDAQISLDSLAKIESKEVDKDSLKIWYTLPIDTSWHIYFKRDTITDTITIPARLKTTFPGAVKLTEVFSPSGNPPKIPSGGSYLVYFNHPVSSADLKKFELIQDTTRISTGLAVEVDSINKRLIKIRFPWKEGSVNTLRVLPNGVQDIFGLVNSDTIKRSFIIGNQKEYGSLTLKVENLDSTLNYHVRLLSSSQVVVRSWQADNQSDFLIKIAQLDPGAYSIEVIEDLDKNGRWTTGSYDQKRQPERVFKKTLDLLRSNWELVTEVKVKFD